MNQNTIQEIQRLLHAASSYGRAYKELEKSDSELALQAELEKSIASVESLLISNAEEARPTLDELAAESYRRISVMESKGCSSDQATRIIRRTLEIANEQLVARIKDLEDFVKSERTAGQSIHRMVEPLAAENATLRARANELEGELNSYREHVRINDKLLADKLNQLTEENANQRKIWQHEVEKLSTDNEELRKALQGRVELLTNEPKASQCKSLEELALDTSVNVCRESMKDRALPDSVDFVTDVKLKILAALRTVAQKDALQMNEMAAEIERLKLQLEHGKEGMRVIADRVKELESLEVYQDIYKSLHNLTAENAALSEQLICAGNERNHLAAENVELKKALDSIIQMDHCQGMSNRLPQTRTAQLALSNLKDEQKGST